MNRQRIIVVAVWVSVAILAGMAETTQAGSHDYEFVVDQSQSDLELLIYMDLGFPLGSDSDSASSQLTGTLGATLTPEFGDFSNIRIIDLSLDLVNDLSFDLFSGLVTGTGSNLGMLMGGSYGSAGPATAVSSGNFSQTGNLVQSVGVMEFDSPFGSDTVNLIDDPPSPMDFVGTVADDGSNITITVPLSMYWDLNESAGIDGYATLSGSVVARTLTYYPPDPLSLEFVEVSDPGGDIPSGYRTYDLMANTGTNLAAFEMILGADTPDSIYQHEGGNGYYEPNPFLIGGYPELEFDTYVTMGAWPYPSPVNAIGGAVDIVPGSVLTFDEQNLNITWATSGGSYQSGPGTFPVARVTLADAAGATYTVMGWQTGESGPVTVTGQLLPRLMPGDVTGEGFVGADDLVVILTNWGLSGLTREQGDLTGEGFVGADDYVEVLTYWGTGSAAPEPTPEPTTMSLLLAGALLLGKAGRSRS